LVPIHKQPGLKAGAFNPALLVPVATTETNRLYKPRLKTFFSVCHISMDGSSASHGCSDEHPKICAIFLLYVVYYGMWAYRYYETLNVNLVKRMSPKIDRFHAAWVAL
jgi:hypothetical protein